MNQHILIIPIKLLLILIIITNLLNVTNNIVQSILIQIQISILIAIAITIWEIDQEILDQCHVQLLIYKIKYYEWE